MGRPKKKKVSHYGQGTICKLADGRFAVTMPYRNIDGIASRLVVTSTKSLEAAQEKLKSKAEKLNIIDGMQMPRGPGVTLNRSSTLHDVLVFAAENKYRLNVKYSTEKPMRNRSIASYNTVARMIDNLIGDTYLRDIDEEVIYFLFTTHQKGNAELNISPKSRSILGTMYSIMKLTLDFGVINGVIDKNIMRDEYYKIKVPQSIVVKEKVVGYSDAEVKSMIDALKKHSIDIVSLPVDQRYKRNVIDLYTAFMLTISTGMRSEELLGLEWHNIDINKQQIKINQAASFDYEFDGLKSKKRRPIVDETKTRSSIRSLMISDEVMDLMLRLKERNDTFGYTGEFLFISLLTKKSYTGPGLQDAFNSFFKFAGLDINFRAHRLRHNCASILEDEGQNNHQIMSQLGISRISTLRIYTDRGDRLQKQNSDIIFGAIKERYLDDQQQHKQEPNRNQDHQD